MSLYLLDSRYKYYLHWLQMGESIIKMREIISQAFGARMKG
jgi:hypothetical protein